MIDALSCCHSTIKMWLNIHIFLGLFVVLSTTWAYDKGIDVSHHQGDINWQKVKAAGIKFAIAKATEGSTYQDTKFLQNWQGIKKNNIKAGAYHYLLGNAAVASQVGNIKGMLQKCGFDANNDVLAIDVEGRGNTNVTPEKMADTLNGVLAGLKNTYKNIYIYCGPSYWENKVAWKKYDFSGYNLWIAHYTKQASPTLPSTWKSRGYTWWQYSETGKVDGINGYVDLDRTK